jgi:hypothetical protein
MKSLNKSISQKNILFSIDYPMPMLSIQYLLIWKNQKLFPPTINYVSKIIDHIIYRRYIEDI